MTGKKYTTVILVEGFWMIFSVVSLSVYCVYIIFMILKQIYLC